MADDLGFPRDAATVHLWGSCSIRSEGVARDQRLLLILNNHQEHGSYHGWSLDSHPSDTLGHSGHGAAQRWADNGFVVGYAGWQLDVDVLFSGTLSIAVGRPRIITGTYTVTRGGEVMYISSFGGTYRGVEPIISGQLTLPDAGAFVGEIRTGLIAAGD